MDFDYSQIVEKTLPQLSYHIIKYIDKHNNNDRFIENIPSYYYLIVESFS